jgi:hypothetical protein
MKLWMGKFMRKSNLEITDVSSRGTDVQIFRMGKAKLSAEESHRNNGFLSQRYHYQCFRSETQFYVFR